MANGRSREKFKGRRSSGGRGYSQLIHDYFQSPEYAALSPRAVKALIDLFCQFRGANNGDLCATWKFMARVGWTSKDQLNKAIDELIDADWLTVTRQGGRRIPTLYGLTFLPIDECGGKLDVSATREARHSWKREGMSLRKSAVIPLSRPAGQTTPPHGSINERAA
jgi:hypothetical protein